MIAFLIAIAGVAIYVMSENGDSDKLVVSGALGLIAIGSAVGAGVVIGASRPAFSRWMMWTWTPGVVLVFGGLAAIVIGFAVQLTVGEGASNETKAVYAAIVAAVTGLMTTIKGWAGNHLAPWISTKAICWRYGSLFPCVPEGAGPGRKAKDAISRPCGSSGTIMRDGAAVQDVLTKIQAAIVADEVKGGQNWKCLDLGPAPG